MSTRETREFKYSTNYNMCNLVYSLLALAGGTIGHTVHLKLSFPVPPEFLILADICFILSGAMFTVFLWSRVHPFVLITPEEIRIFPQILIGKTFRKPNVIKWDTIRGINRISKRWVIFGRDHAELLLSNDKKVEIPLLIIAKKDRDDLIQTLEAGFQKRPLDEKNPAE